MHLRILALGRPWRNHSTVIYMNSFIDRHIQPQGWATWYANTLGDYSHIYYAEYNNYGPGSWGPNVVARETLNFTRLINATEANQFQLHEWYDDLSWIDGKA
ncbi:pectinesterase [Jimgerdemannia flammicorona]|nr:pectinesterase [Jimgerdemannia flammicorona]